jgi:hypothetical protein
MFYILIEPAVTTKFALASFNLCSWQACAIYFARAPSLLRILEAGQLARGQFSCQQEGQKLHKHYLLKNTLPVLLTDCEQIKHHRK